VKTRGMIKDNAEEQKEIEELMRESSKQENGGGKRAPIGCPLKCGAAKLPDDKEVLIKHLLTYCNRMPIKCQLCELVFTKNEFYGCFDNPE